MGPATDLISISNTLKLLGYSKHTGGSAPMLKRRWGLEPVGCIGRQHFYSAADVTKAKERKDEKSKLVNGGNASPSRNPQTFHSYTNADRELLEACHHMLASIMQELNIKPVTFGNYLRDNPQV